MSELTGGYWRDDPNRPDPNVRKCKTCLESWAPYSMQPSGQPVVGPPVDYTCITCRTVKAGV